MPTYTLYPVTFELVSEFQLSDAVEFALVDVLVDVVVDGLVVTVGVTVVVLVGVVVVERLVVVAGTTINVTGTDEFPDLST